MAIDNLNYYSAWLPAGQQTDRYSSKPWCLRSKNLDIFSSSKSVKATAFSQPVAIGSDIIKEEWWLVLKTDWKVYDSEWTLVVDPSQNFPVYQVSYNWKNGDYADAQRWTVKDMVVKAVWDEWQSFVVYTDRSAYYYSKIRFTPLKNLSSQYTRWRLVDWLNRWDGGYIWWYENSAWSYNINFDLTIKEYSHHAKIPVRLKINAWAWADFSTWQVTITWPNKKKYYYDAELDQIVSGDDDWAFNIALSWSLADWFTLILPEIPTWWDQNWNFNIRWGYSWDWWQIWIDVNWVTDGTTDPTYSPDSSMKDWDYNEYYEYLPIDENRTFVDIGEYYWMPSQSFQILWEWNSSWEEVNGEKQLRWKFQQYMWWANPTEMTVIWMIAWNESIYMIGNMNWNWYIFPCDLTWWRWTPYIAYGCTFNWVTNIDYLMYLVWDDRGISQLWVFNQQELVSLVWWNKDKQYNDIIDNDEQYRFDWKIVEYRWNLILSTEDNRLFEYGQTYGGKWGTFIHEIDGEIKELKVKGNDLIVKYSNNNIDYTIIYQDDTPIKNYNIEWEAEYPIVIWNHLLEKEESDLYASYIIPDSACKLEFWASANHYHFWSFKTDWQTIPTVWEIWDIEWTGGTEFFKTTQLEFVEANDWWLTFKLVGKMPVMTWGETWKLVKLGKLTSDHITYTEFNHFRKIWEITADKFTEWEFRFTNLNNKLELPKSHSLQIMVKGKGNQNYTPELFALDLVANQRERW